METIRLTSDNKTLIFQRIALTFHEQGIIDAFAHKNNKTLLETVSGRRYKHLSQLVSEKHEAYLQSGLGEFLLELKLSGDSLYERFLNPYGDENYCRFTIEKHLDSKGLYCFEVDNCIVYVGRCVDNFAKRVNNGYGRISPKNCYLDGQSTNCRLNSLINKHRDLIKFYICCLKDDTAIRRFERTLIQQLRPEWNIALKH